MSHDDYGLEPRDFVFGQWDIAKYAPEMLAGAVDLLRKQAKENPEPEESCDETR